MRWRRNPLHITPEERGLPTEKSRKPDNRESGSGFPSRNATPPFGTGARVLTAVVSLAVAGFFITRGRYVIVALMVAGVIANEILIRRRSGG